MTFIFEEKNNVNVPVFRIQISIRIQIIMLLSLPDPHPDPSVRGTDLRIRICTKMLQIRYTGFLRAKLSAPRLKQKHDKEFKLKINVLKTIPELAIFSNQLR